MRIASQPTLQKHKMKPTVKISSRERASRSDSFDAAARPSFPNTDYRFQAPGDIRGGSRSFSDGAERFAAARDFHKLTGEYLNVETRSLFAELGAFAAIVAVSLWPIVSMIRVVAQLLK
jgi:hypothetical protein